MSGLVTANVLNTKISEVDDKISYTNGLVNSTVLNTEISKVEKQNSQCVPLYSNFILNLYIVYELNTCPLNPVNNFTLKYCLFGTVKLVRNVDKSKLIYNG